MKEIKYKLLPPHQTNFFNSKSRYLLNSGGVGSGKTYSIVLKALKLIEQYPGIFGLIGAQTYPLLRDTTLREFINVTPKEMIISYNRSEQHFRFCNGSEVIFRSFDDENKLKSLNLGFCGIEEMTDIPEEIFKMLRTRMRQDGMPGCIFGATNPNAFGNWVYKYFIEKPHVLPDSETIYSISADNTYLPKEYLKDLEHMKQTNPEYYQRMVMGQWGLLEGVIYNLPISQRVESVPEVKKVHRFIAGLDFGYNHPTTIIPIGLRDPNYYIPEEVYRREMKPPEIVEECKILMGKYPIDVFYCDSARADLIAYLQDCGIPAQDSIKDVFDGIMYVKGIIGENRLHVHNSCTYTLREFDSYIWDAKNVVKEVPVKINDDCMDAIRYALFTDSRKGMIWDDDSIILGEDRETGGMDF